MKKYFVLGFALAASTACQQKKTQNNTVMPILHDTHSYAQPNDVVVTHLDLSLTANFSSKILTGKATWQIENKIGADSIFLDTRDLNIQKITLDNDSANAPFKLSPANGVFGQKLAIAIAKTTKQLCIHYRTSPKAAALQWLNPEQTAGKKFPFLFSQSEAILARTWLPCQDSPGIRFTYNAELKVPNGFLALMSAENPQQLDSDGHYTFKQNKPIPAYLMAIAVGNIEFKAIGSRTGVYAEPAMLQAVHYEFAQMEDMLTAAEKLYGPYTWGRYDILVLPPSFPFGGMENPCLTFSTPTVITGDRSLVSLVAHELAHSWSGNLVTNATWNDFWLNEGFTVYFERRIMEAIEGKEYADMLIQIGKDDFVQTLTEMSNTNPDTQLKLKLDGRNPDDGMTDIAYEKGFFLLRMIENTVGRDKFDTFLKKYFADHAFQTSNTEGFLAYLKKELFAGNEKAYEQMHIEDWVYKPGMPANFPAIQSKRLMAVESACKNLEAGKLPDTSTTNHWSSHEWLHFVRHLPENITLTQMTALDKTFHFTKTGNDEVLCVWLELSLKKQYKPAYAEVERFLCSVGRRKFLLPLYKTMLKTPEGKDMARQIYAKARPNYHSVATETLDKLLN